MTIDSQYIVFNVFFFNSPGAVPFRKEETLSGLMEKIKKNPFYKREQAKHDEPISTVLVHDKEVVDETVYAEFKPRRAGANPVFVELLIHR